MLHSPNSDWLPELRKGLPSIAPSDGGACPLLEDHITRSVRLLLGN